MRPTLLTLPEELLDRIIHFLPDTHTLTTLCTVSKTLKRIATPHLYTHITLSSHAFTYLRPLAFLLWTSLNHRCTVRSFNVSRAYGGNLIPWPEHPDLESVVNEMVGRYVREEEKEAWLQRVREGNDALAIASVLLRSLPGVREMGFDGFKLVDPGVRGLS